MQTSSEQAQVVNTAVIASTFGLTSQLSEQDYDQITSNLLIIIHKIAGVELHMIPEDSQPYVIDEVLKLVNDFVDEFRAGYIKINPEATDYQVALAAGKSLGLLIDSI
ncbi:MAG: hypothetical protein H7230_02595 [Candidatus Parcubacteria bacterium]|nr:hypothetical protein [Candidatus Paceibacterota bacterium]